MYSLVVATNHRSHFLTEKYFYHVEKNNNSNSCNMCGVVHWQKKKWLLETLH